jgi:hypothetical protein
VFFAAGKLSSYYSGDVLAPIGGERRSPADVAAMARRGERLQRFRTVLLLVVFVVGLGLLLTQCPANRDGMPGQLATAMEEATSAACSGALALDLWNQQRATNQLTSVQLSDARDEILKAYKGIADLKAEDPVDIQRQKMLTEAMTAIIGQLNAAVAAVSGVTAGPSPQQARDGLLASAQALESGYRRCPNSKRSRWASSPRSAASSTSATWSPTRSLARGSGWVGVGGGRRRDRNLPVRKLGRAGGRGQRPRHV